MRRCSCILITKILYINKQQLQLLKQELTVSQILGTYGKQFKQITERYSDGYNGRCTIMSYYGWNGKDDSQVASKLLGTLIALRCASIDKNLLIEMNDSGLSFDEIADYLDKIGSYRRLIDLRACSEPISAFQKWSWSV